MMDLEFWLSLVLTLVGFAGFILAGRKVWWAWHVNVANQAVWITFAIVSGNWPFLLGALVYTVIFTKNAMMWTKEHKDAKEEK